MKPTEPCGGVCSTTETAPSGVIHQPETIQIVDSQPSWMLASDVVELAITQLGGHMAPVTFYRSDERPIQPYYVSPWQNEKLTIDAPVLVPLRGDFFCMPFGGNAVAYKGEKHPPHGEPAGSTWTFAGAEKKGKINTLTLTMNTTVRPGKVTKKLCLVDGQNVVYSQHLLEGYSDKMPLGHHAILAVSEAEGSLQLTTSAFQFGMTCPGVFGNPANREYQSFASGQKFQDLRRVPLIWKDPATADCTSLPARTGFTDLLALFSHPREKIGQHPAWTTVVNPKAGYLWFAMREPAQLPTTAFWIANRGRHGAPWNGRNRCLGIEDVCGFFAEGLVPSAKTNVLNQAGIPTTIKLSPTKPTAINYLQGVVQVPKGFERVGKLEFGTNEVVFISTNNKKVAAQVQYQFLETGML